MRPDWQEFSDHELRVREILEEAGWSVTPFGRITFGKAVNDELDVTRLEEPVRFLPDFLAVKGGVVMAVDPKGTTERRADSPNWVIAEPALQAMYDFSLAMHIKCYVVWSDYSVSTVKWLEESAKGIRSLRPPADPTRRTPFWLYPKDLTPSQPISVIL
ncbi:MAG: hypothetical protein ACWGQW_15525 [bacterium]